MLPISFSPRSGLSTRASWLDEDLSSSDVSRRNCRLPSSSSPRRSSGGRVRGQAEGRLFVHPRSTLARYARRPVSLRLSWRLSGGLSLVFSPSQFCAAKRPRIRAPRPVRSPRGTRSPVGASSVRCLVSAPSRSGCGALADVAAYSRRSGPPSFDGDPVLNCVRSHLWGLVPAGAPALDVFCATSARALEPGCRGWAGDSASFAIAATAWTDRGV